MKNFALIVLLAGTAAPGGQLFELHVESSRNAPAAIAWVLPERGGNAQTVYLDREVLLDEKSVATADVAAGPDGSAGIRLGLTPDGAQRLAEITSRNVGKRLGIVAAGKLRAAPYVTGGIMGGVLVVAGGLSESEARELARRLGPPAPKESERPTSARAVEGQAFPAAPLEANAIRALQGNWRVASASMEGRPVGDPKLVRSTWSFDGAGLVLTNGEGQSERFALRRDAALPALLRLDPLPPSHERGGWVLFAREGEGLRVAFLDNLQGRPEDFAPARKKVVLELARAAAVENGRRP